MNYKYCSYDYRFVWTSWYASDWGADGIFQLKGSGTMAANNEGTGGSAFIGLKDSDDGTIAFMGVDGGKLKFQTSGSSY